MRTRVHCTPQETWARAADCYARLGERYEHALLFMNLIRSLDGSPYQDALYVHASPYLALHFYLIRGYPERTQAPHVFAKYVPERRIFRLEYHERIEPWPVYQERLRTGEDMYERPLDGALLTLATLLDRMLAARNQVVLGRQTGGGQDGPHDGA